jgi:hypothetical protein
MTAPGRRWWFAAERGGFLDYCLIAWPLALVPSILLAALAYYILAGAGADMAAIQKPMRDVAQRKIWIALLAAPLIETLVLALGIRVVSFFTKNREAVAIVSALAWGALHASFYPIWFFGTVWSFYVFSRGYLAWRPVSVKHALAAAAVPHAHVNSSALLMQFWSSR